MTNTRRNKLLEKSTREALRTGRRVYSIGTRATESTPDDESIWRERGFCAVGRLPLQSTRLVDILSKPVYRSQLLGQFVDQCSVTHGHENTTAWEKFLPTLAARTRSAYLASLALSCACLSREHNDTALLREATTVYGRALSSLQRELFQGQGAYDDANLAACLAMVSFQLYCNDPSMAGWAAHLNGIKSIMQLRGPHAFAAGIAHHLFLAFRFTLMLHTMYAGVPPNRNFLASETWRTVPWSLNPKSSYHELLDVVAELPSLTASCIGLDEGTSPDTKANLRRSVITAAWTLKHKLKHQWYENLPLEVRSPTIVESALSVSSTVDSASLGQSYRFVDTNACSTLLLYWTCLLLVHTALELNYLALQGVESSYLTPANSAALRCSTCYLRFALSCDITLDGCRCGWLSRQSVYDISDLPVQPDECAILDPAWDICMALEYCMDQGAKSWASAALIWPMNWTLRVLTSRWPATEPQIEWWHTAIEHFHLHGHFSTIPFWNFFLKVSGRTPGNLLQFDKIRANGVTSIANTTRE